MLAQNFKSAGDLGIEEHVRSALAKVLVLLETEAILREQFMMDFWPVFGTPCWSGGCIGAWAEKVGGFEIENADFLHEDRSDLYNLFFLDERDGARSPYKATPAEGARALRNYLTTGKASWPDVMGRARA